MAGVERSEDGAAVDGRDAELLVDGVARVVDREQEVAGELHAWNIQRHRRAQLTRHAVVRQQEAPLPVRQRHHVRAAAAEAQRHIARDDARRVARDASGRIRGGRLLEAEIAAQGLARDAELNARALDADEWSRWNIEEERRAADGELLVHRARRLVDGKPEASAELNAHRNIQADARRQRAGDSIRADDEEPFAVLDLDHAAKREADVRRRHAHALLTGGVRHLLEGEVAAQGLAEHRQRGRRSSVPDLHAEIRTSRKLEADALAADEEIFANRRRGVVDRDIERAGELDARIDVDAEVAAEFARETGGRQEQLAGAVRYLDERIRRVAER